MSEAEVRKDIQELKSILATASRENTIKLITQEKQRLEVLLSSIVQKAAASSEKKVVTSSKRALVTIKNYAWDQSDKFVKIYLTNLNGVHTLEADQLNLSLENEQQPVFTITNLGGKDYKFTTPKLLNTVEKVTFKQKENMILLMYKKVNVGEKWDCLTEKEKVEKEATKPPKTDENADPSASIMSMMKKMYEEGDDDMKRTISKAWTESRDKQGMGGMPGMPGM